MKNFSVIKISNSITNELTKKEICYTVSTEIKKDDGDGAVDEEESDHHHHGDNASAMGKSDEGTPN